MLRGLDIFRTEAVPEYASELHYLNPNARLGKAVLGGAKPGTKYLLSKPARVEFVSGLRIYTRDMLDTLDGPFQVINAVSVRSWIVTLKTPDSKVIAHRIPIARFVGAVTGTIYPKGSSKVDLYFAPGILIDPRQSYMEVVLDAGQTDIVPYQWLYY